MKSILKYIPVFIMLFVAFSCEEEDPVLFKVEDSFVAFDNTAGVVPEGSPTAIEIPVSVATHKGASVTVTFEFSTEGIDNPAVEGVDFTLVNSSKTLTFAEGVGSEMIKIQAIDNGVRDLDKYVKIKIVSNSAGFDLGMAGGLGLEYTLTVADDEHPLALVLGNYVESDYLFPDGSLEATYNVIVEPDPDDETKVLINNLWGGGEIISAIVDLDNMTLTIPAGTVIYVSGTYGDCVMTRIDLNAGAYDPAGDIVCTIKANGDFTSEAWAALVAAGSFGNYLKAEFVKQ